MKTCMEQIEQKGASKMSQSEKESYDLGGIEPRLVIITWLREVHKSGLAGPLEAVETESGNGKRKWSNCYICVKASLSGHLLKTTFLQRPPLYKDHFVIRF